MAIHTKIDLKYRATELHTQQMNILYLYIHFNIVKSFRFKQPLLVESLIAGLQSTV